MSDDIVRKCWMQFVQNCLVKFAMMIPTRDWTPKLSNCRIYFDKGTKVDNRENPEVRQVGQVHQSSTK